MNTQINSPYLAAPMFCIDVSWHWKSGVENLLCVIHWGLQKVAEIFIFWHVLISWLAPLRYGLILKQLKELLLLISCLSKNVEIFFPKGSYLQKVRKFKTLFHLTQFFKLTILILVLSKQMQKLGHYFSFKIKKK